VEAIFEVQRQPQLLAATLESADTALAHGNLRGANLGLVAQGIVLLDWGLAASARAAVDFAPGTYSSTRDGSRRPTSS
jgi:tRNA A-37 threonylcarbamoyl transferase component Bud32